MIIVLGGMAGTLMGQYEPEEEKLPDARNTIGTNLTPALVYLLNAYPSVPRFTLQYKRQQRINRKLRISVNYEIRDRYDETLEEGNVVGVGDSIAVFDLDRAFNYIVDVRGGMEWFKPNRVFTMVYGVDLYAGYRRDYSGTDRVTLKLTDLGFIPHPDVPTASYEKAIEYGVAGFDFSIGSQFRASDKINFVIRWTPQFGYRSPIKEYYSDPALRTDPALGTIDLHLRLLELYVNYVF